MNHLTIFGQLGFLVKWETGDDGQYDMDITSFCMMFLLSHLETLRTCFWKTNRCANCITDFSHRTSQSTSGPVVMALTFPRKQLAVHDTKHNSDSMQKPHLWGAPHGKLQAKIWVFWKFRLLYFLWKNDWNTNRSTKIRLKMSLCSNGDGFWN